MNLKGVDLTRVIPESLMGDERMKAVAESLSRLLRSVAFDVKEVLHLPRLDEIDGQLLDLLAWQMHVDYWEPHLTVEQKRSLIKESMSWHRRLGTVSAVEELCSMCWTACRVEEWFDYGGEPYHFRIVSKGWRREPDDFSTFKKLLTVSKNERSWLDEIVLDYSPEPLKVGLGLVTTLIGQVELFRSKPPPVTLRLTAGLGLIRQGELRLKRSRPQLNPLAIKISTFRCVVGNIGQKARIAPVQYEYRQPLRIRLQRWRLGSIIWKKPQQGAADLLDDDDPLPTDYVGSFIWYRFWGLSSKRSFKLRNARLDVTEPELREVADFILENNVLLTSKGEPLTRVIRASVATISEKKIFKEVTHI